MVPVPVGGMLLLSFHEILLRLVRMSLRLPLLRYWFLDQYVKNLG